MASATITLQSVCAGGDHVVVRRTIGGNSVDFSFSVDQLREPITQVDQREALQTIIRFHCQGMTKAEAKAELEPPGISVVTS